MVKKYALTITTVIGMIFLTSMIISMQIPSVYAKRQTSSLFDRLLPLPNIVSSSPSSDRASGIISSNNPDNSNTISPNAAGGNKIPDGSVTTSKLANGAVTNPKLALDAVTSDKIQDGEVNTDDIAADAITGNKISDSFMKRVTLADDSDGNSKGWTPDDFIRVFNIIDPDVSHNSIVVVNIHPGIGVVCTANDVNDGTFSITCTESVARSNELHYLIINVPESQSS